MQKLNKTDPKRGNETDLRGVVSEILREEDEERQYRDEIASGTCREGRPYNTTGPNPSQGSDIGFVCIILGQGPEYPEKFNITSTYCPHQSSILTKDHQPCHIDEQHFALS